VNARPEDLTDEVELTITLGRDTVTTVDLASTSLLLAARAAGLRPPSSCEQGNCATCIARVVQGAVEMRVNDVLEDDEVTEGWVLTCQGFPVTPVVEVVYE
jgi:ferredoxin